MARAKTKAKANPATRDPKPPPFQIGTRLRGTAEQGDISMSATPDGPSVRVNGHGVEVVVDEVMPGRRGTGLQQRDSDGPMFWEDTGEPMIDETKDGMSVYHVTDASGRKHGRLIRHERAELWEVVHPLTERCPSHPGETAMGNRIPSAKRTHEAIAPTVEEVDQGRPVNDHRCAYCDCAVECVEDSKK